MFGRGDEPAAQLSAPRPAHKRIPLERQMIMKAEVAGIDLPAT